MARVGRPVLCDRCLGRRLIGALGAAAQREAAQGQGTGLPEPECAVCEGRFADEARWLEVVLAALEPYEFASFQLGTVFPKECEEAEQEHRHLRPEIGDSIRTEANRLLAPQVAAARGAQWRNDARPDIAVTLDTRFWTAEVTSNSVYLLGRYTKHRRDVPQTHWPCKTCQGPGCHACNGRGWMYASSVEQAIGDVVAPAFGATAYSFHGAGREDIDALMLGTGRPFVLEVAHPRHRQLPDGHLELLVGAVEEAKAGSGVGLVELAPTEKETVAALKAAEYGKEYLAHCITEADVDRAAVEAVAASLAGTVLEQRTPERVSHRRADLVRRRRVQEVEVVAMPDARHFSLRVLAESGAYIKELVSGDEGRTTPNVAGLLGVPCRVEFLDVLRILDGPVQGTRATAPPG